MNVQLRRTLGAHFTSEENILKVIKPLFLDALWAEFEKVKSNRNKLFEFHKKLRTLTFFDPACGCGNFLVISYRELRLVELAVLRASHHLSGNQGQQSVDVHGLIGVNVDQFYGIEIEEFPAQIAQVAMWLMDHQMNLQVSEEFGLYFARIPLRTSPHVVHGNALRLDWNEVLPAQRCSFLVGNPPFLGKTFQSNAQKADLAFVLGAIQGAGVLDFVSGWYVKAANYLHSGTTASTGRMPGAHTLRFLKSPPTSAPHSPHGVEVSDERGQVMRGQGSGVGSEFRTATSPETANVERNSALTPVPALSGASQTRVAFVSTNSITQGEQVGVLWSWMLAQGIHIQFAHRTFKWSNEASGKAAVHCVIIGFGLQDHVDKTIYEYADIACEPHAVFAKNINPYLVDSIDVALSGRTAPICPVPTILFGSKPTDGGHLLLTGEERDALLTREPKIAPYLRTYLSAEEFINGPPRYCLWLKDCPPNLLSAMPHALAHVEAVRKFRLASTKAGTRDNANMPTLFAEDRQPTTQFLALPKTSSERRLWIPISFLTPETVIASELFSIQKATLYHFGILSSTMHMAWTRYTCGRLKSDIRYSASIVYNNYPWPEFPQKFKPNQPVAPVNSAQAAIETAAQTVLDVRAKFQSGDRPATLADLYDPLTMPPELLKAHQKLDAAVDKAYEASGGKKSYKSDAERVAFLFELYQKVTSLLPAEKVKTKRRSGVDAAQKEV
nr:DNA methyltransferase [Rhodoferax sp.]